MCFAPTTACTFSTSLLPKVVRTWCALYNFDLKKCFAPQRRALFRHLNFQKCSETQVFCTFSFSLWNVLRATTACNFSSLIWPAGSAPAALASLLFDSAEATNHWKNTVFRDFPPFSRICIFFLLTLSLLLFSLLIFLFSLPLPYSAFHLSILSEVWLLNFLRLNVFWESLETLGFARNSGESGFTPRTERKRPFQIEDYWVYQPQILKTRLCNKPFFNRSYSVGWSTKSVLLVLV